MRTQSARERWRLRWPSTRTPARGVIDPNEPSEGLSRLAEAYPLGRLGEPADVGDAAVFLLGNGASWITGITLPVDGGLTSLHL